jgi:hypothetical protein
VENERSGLVTEPEPSVIARAIDRLAEKSLAERLGEQALAASQAYTWPRAIDALLA